LTVVGDEWSPNSSDRYHLFSDRPFGEVSTTAENARIQILPEKGKVLESRHLEETTQEFYVPDAINSTDTD
jgi:hypothetical protein